MSAENFFSNLREEIELGVAVEFKLFWKVLGVYKTGLVFQSVKKYTPSCLLLFVLHGNLRNSDQARSLNGLH